MRRRRYKPLISFIPKNKVLVDRAEKILEALGNSEFLCADGENTPTQVDALVARLNAELSDVASKLRLQSITQKMVDDFTDDWNKQTIPNMDVFVKKVGDVYLATTDGKACELIDFENEYPFSENEVACISIVPDIKNSDIYFRDTFFRIYNKAITSNENMISFLNSADLEKVVFA